ncbi:Holliday junction branch migration protein RuvA [uncultured Bifidobacterium sp.]|uniref:Holliday junction branch migration protein RuvA n=1 Tax=uncultured Bifidobacterium sp. TaxID=165187 RepID=UPI0028DC077F|nr:Holliday junction branch migration protein RuvA [uncultured Bifidobacterium sp.]
MIGMLRGQVVSVDGNAALILVGGIGFDVHMPHRDLAALHAGADVSVSTVLAVAQDQPVLYGFLTAAAKRMFLQLQKASGIGPKVAQSLLSTLTPDDLARAIADGDAAALAKAPGLGRKGAQKIILELRGSIDVDASAGPVGSADDVTEPTVDRQVVEGLVSLGWSEQEAGRAVSHVRLEGRNDDSVSAATKTPDAVPEDAAGLLREALAWLDRGR